jgi:hypothetical protein
MYKGLSQTGHCDREMSPPPSSVEGNDDKVNEDLDSDDDDDDAGECKRIHL